MENNNSQLLHFRPLSIHYIEEDRVDINQMPTFTIIVKVAYYIDELQTRKISEVDMTFEKVSYDPTWDGSLATIYSLIKQ